MYRTAARRFATVPNEPDLVGGEVVRVKDPSSFRTKLRDIVGRVICVDGGRVLVAVGGVEWLFARDEIERTTR